MSSRTTISLIWYMFRSAETSTSMERGPIWGSLYGLVSSKRRVYRGLQFGFPGGCDSNVLHSQRLNFPPPIVKKGSNNYRAAADLVCSINESLFGK
ncbi:hypothetical protein BDW67DRAFT_161917 [Aspergillus spinulosporus]